MGETWADYREHEGIATTIYPLPTVLNGIA